MPRRRKAPAGCYWRGNTLWGRVKIRGRLVRWSLETDDPAIAKARRKAGKERAIADVHGDASRTFEEVFTAWDVQLERTVGAKTAKRYLCSLKQLAPWLEGKVLSAINGPLVAGIIRERQRYGVTNATIRRDLGALSSVMNFAILQGWIEVNPIVPKLALVPEKRDPILLPTDRNIELVIERAPGMIGQMVTAALKTGAREEELVRAKRSDLDHSRKQLTVIGKGNKLRVIDVRPFDGYTFLAALPAYVGKPHLFWHGNGASYSSFADPRRDLGEGQRCRIPSFPLPPPAPPPRRRLAEVRRRHLHVAGTARAHLGQNHRNVSRLPDARRGPDCQIRRVRKTGRR